ncbi:MAG: ATP-binding protein [Paludibacter sp.]|nr:ATP-binding protein [Paludibacter sp.]
MKTKIKIAIASGKGGTGKTFISTNLFRVLQKQSIDVTLVDCDAEEPNDLQFISGSSVEAFSVTQKVPVIDKTKCTYCGKCFEYCNYNAIFYLQERTYIEVLEDQCHGCGACSVACNFAAITEKENELGTVETFRVSENAELIEARMKIGVHSPVSTIKAAIKSAKNSVVLFDSPPGTSCPFIQTVSFADYVVLVTEPTPFGLSDLKQSVETLKSMNKCCGVIVNRSTLGTNEVYEYLNQEKIPLLMSVPFDKNIALHYSKGNVLAEKDIEWSIKFNQLYNTILERYGDSCN